MAAIFFTRQKLHRRYWRFFAYQFDVACTEKEKQRGGDLTLTPYIIIFSPPLTIIFYKVVEVLWVLKS
jgi:hypothetical protein